MKAKPPSADRQCIMKYLDFDASRNQVILKNIKKILVTGLIVLTLLTGCKTKTGRYEGYGEADPYPNVTNAEIIQFYTACMLSTGFFVVSMRCQYGDVLV